MRHSRFARQAQMQHVNVTVMTTADPYVELGFIADDRPGLLAMITATLAAARFKVISAQVYSWVDSFGRTRALDLFWVRGGETTDSVTGSMARVECVIRASRTARPPRCRRRSTSTTAVRPITPSSK
jgi:UTP:GlnB (protein PII) uridylyltransferase